MPDRPRPVPPAAPHDPADDAEGGDRESRVEQLLLAGLDRRNSRARAYIDRARGLVAERQREVEALVHEGVAAYHSGDLATARTLLTGAIDRGGHSDTAQLFLERLHRSESLPGAAPALPRAVPHREPSASRPLWSWLVTAAVSATLAVVILVAARPVASFVADLPIAMPRATPPPVEPLPIARVSDRALAQARELHAQGRHADALRVLETIDVADPQRPAADALRSEIQRMVLAEIPMPNVTAEAAR